MNWRDKALGMAGANAKEALNGPADDWVPLKSSHLDAVRKTDNALYVRFKDGRVYRYDGKQDHHDALVAAESPGAYHAKHLR